jgi:hypothetical protein
MWQLEYQIQAGGSIPPLEIETNLSFRLAFFAGLPCRKKIEVVAFSL